MVSHVLSHPRLRRTLRRSMRTALKALDVAGAGPRRRMTPVQDLVPSRQVRWTPLHSAREVHVDAMDIGDARDNSFYWEHLRRRSGARGGAGWLTYDAGIVELSRGRVAMPSGIHGVDGRFLTETNLMLGDKFPPPTATPDALSIWRRRPTAVADGVLLSLALSRNYYHWLVEILPRLLLLERSGLHEGLPLYVGADLPPFVVDSLRAAGVADRVVALPAGMYEAERLIVPTLLSPAGRPSPDAVAWVRRALRPPDGEQPPTERLLVTRRDAKERHLTNEDEVLAALEPLGFRRVALGGMSFGDQVELFRRAEAVVGGHGAGFANAVFCPPGAAVLEIVTRRHWGVGISLASKLAGVRKGVIAAEDDDGHLVVDDAAHVARVVAEALGGTGGARAMG